MKPKSKLARILLTMKTCRSARGTICPRTALVYVMQVPNYHRLNAKQVATLADALVPANPFREVTAE